MGLDIGVGGPILGCDIGVTPLGWEVRIRVRYWGDPIGVGVHIGVHIGVTPLGWGVPY